MGFPACMHVVGDNSYSKDTWISTRTTSTTVVAAAAMMQPSGHKTHHTKATHTTATLGTFHNTQFVQGACERMLAAAHPDIVRCSLWTFERKRKTFQVALMTDSFGTITTTVRVGSTGSGKDVLHDQWSAHTTERRVDLHSTALSMLSSQCTQTHTHTVHIHTNRLRTQPHVITSAGKDNRRLTYNLTNSYERSVCMLEFGEIIYQKLNSRQLPQLISAYAAYSSFLLQFCAFVTATSPFHLGSVPLPY